MPLSTVAAIPRPCSPALRALEVAQDRLSEKAFAASLGGTPAPYARVETEDDFTNALVRVGTPASSRPRAMVMTARANGACDQRWKPAAFAFRT